MKFTPYIIVAVCLFMVASCHPHKGGHKSQPWHPSAKKELVKQQSDNI